MIRYHVFYQREDTGFLDCLDVYANDIYRQTMFASFEKDIYEKES